MPKIRSSADLRNNYNEISTFCHTYAEPVFITNMAESRPLPRVADKGLAEQWRQGRNRTKAAQKLLSIQRPGMSDREVGLRFGSLWCRNRVYRSRGGAIESDLSTCPTLPL